MGKIKEKMNEYRNLNLFETTQVNEDESNCDTLTKVHNGYVYTQFFEDKNDVQIITSCFVPYDIKKGSWRPE